MSTLFSTKDPSRNSMVLSSVMKEKEKAAAVAAAENCHVEQLVANASDEADDPSTRTSDIDAILRQIEQNQLTSPSTNDEKSANTNDDLQKRIENDRQRLEARINEQLAGKRVIERSQEVSAEDIRPGAYSIPGPGATHLPNEQLDPQAAPLSPVSSPEDGQIIVDSAFLAEADMRAIVVQESDESIEKRDVCLDIPLPCCNIRVKRPSKKALILLCLVFVIATATLTTLAARGLLSPTKCTSTVENHYENGNICCINKYQANDADRFSNFGSKVSIDGNTLLIGTKRSSDETKVGVVFTKTKNGDWEESAVLGTVRAIDNGFDESVALSGNLAIIGQNGDNPNGGRSGSAFIYKRISKGQWEFEAQLIPDDGAIEDMFGFSADIDGDFAVIGAAHKHDKNLEQLTTHSYFAVDPDDRAHDGSAYIFERERDGSWRQLTKLTPPNGHFLQRFGFSVAISGDTVIIGADADNYFGRTEGMGAAYVYRKDTNSSNWVLQDVLRPRDLARGDHFGDTLDLDGDLAIVGAKFHHDHFNNDIESKGAAYIFRRIESGGWDLEQELFASDGQEDDTFGNSVAIQDDVAVVGAWKEGTGGRKAGAAYVFTKTSGGVWFETTKIVPQDIGPGDHFGGSVDFDGSGPIIIGGGFNAFYAIELC